MAHSFLFTIAIGLFLLTIEAKGQEAIVPAWQEYGTAADQQLGLKEPVVLDFNGDGWSDLLQFQKINGVGNYRLLEGSPLGFTANTFVWEMPSGDFLTFDGTTGDLNGDGFDDLVLGDKAYDDSKGAMEIFYGNAGFNIQAPVLVASPNPVVLGQFGSHFDAGGDVNGDGFDDLVVTEPGQNNSPYSPGRAYCYYGSSNGLMISSPTTILPEHTLQKFALNTRHIGDYNNDGYDDIIIHTGTDILIQEFVEIYLGSPSGLLVDTSYIVGDGIVNEAYAWDLGKAGDVNGDGFDDFFVAIPQHDATLGVLGKVEIHYGTNGSTPFESSLNALPGIASDNWGWSVAPAGDFNADSFDDLVLRDGGHFYIYKGGPNELEELADYDFALGNFNQPNVTACGDINHDGYGDVLAYSPTVKGEDTDWLAGWQAIFHGLSDTRPAFNSEASGCLSDNLFHFQNLTAGPPPTGWLWDFGDGSSSTEESPEHHYSTEGWYTVTLTATTGTGTNIVLQKDSAAVVYKPLEAGSYTVGGASANFATLTSLNRYLQCGITGDVTIKVKNGTYADSLALFQVPTNGFTLTVESESGNRDSVLIEKNIIVQSTDNVVLRNLSAWHNNRLFSVGIEDCQNILLEGCAMYSLDYNSSFSAKALQVLNAENLTVQQCFFDNAILPSQYDNGFALAGIDSSTSVLFKDNDGTENFFNWSFAAPGLWMSVRNSHAVRVEGNDILGMRSNFFKVDTLSVLDNIMEGGLVRVDTGQMVTIQRNKLSGNEQTIRLNNVTGFRVLGNKVNNVHGGIILTGSTGLSQGQFDLIANNAVGGELGLSGQYSDYYQQGIGLLQSKQVRVYHNSVLFDLPSYINSYDWGAALHVIGCDSVDVRNNVFKNPTSTGGYDGGVVYLYGNTNYASDYNAYEGVGFTHPLPNHQQGWDLHSIFAPVQFADQFDLHLDAATPLLNDAAPMLPEVPIDFDGNDRPADFVDIGAFEFDAATVRDVHAELILTDTLVIGQNTISLRVTNQRPTVENSVYLSYQYNDRPPVTELWTGNLNGFGQVDFEFTTPLTLDKGLLSKLKVWVGLSGNTDVYPKNDTLWRNYRLPMEGHYTVGNQPDTDFKDMAEANTSLDSLDLAGDVVMEILPGNYFIPTYSFKHKDSFDDAYSITYQSATGHPADVEWAFGWIPFSKNLIFKDLTIRPISSGGYLFQEEGMEIYDSRDILFTNCRFLGNPDDLANRQVATVYDSKDVEWNGCTFEGFKRGVTFSDFNYFGSAGYMEGNARVVNCEFKGSMEVGIRLNSLPLNQLDFEVSGCKFENVENGILLNTTAVFFTAPYSAKIIGNDIITSYRSINVNVPNHSVDLLIANNFIAEEFGAYLFNPLGETEVAYNSFSPKGIMCLQAENAGQLKLHNNSFDARIQGTYFSPLVFMHGGTYEGDNNNFHQPNPGLPVFEYLNTYCNSLADLQALTGQDINSLSQPPQYAAPNDLHLLPGSPLIGAAHVLPSLSTDYDGEPRDATTPDIGADEYHPCYGADTAPTVLSGHVTTSDGISPLANSAVTLIGFDQSNGSVGELNLATTDANGFYQFTTSAPTVFLRVVPDPITYPDEVPTYFGNSVAIQGATCIQLDSANITANFGSIHNFNSGGNSNISGVVIEGDGFVAGDPIVNLPVFLMDESLNPVAWALTNSEGVFEVDNLPIGKYSFWVDKAWVSNALAPFYTLASDSASLDFELNSYYLDLLESSLPSPSVVTFVQPAFCNGPAYFGSAAATVSGGTPPFNIAWDNFHIGETNNALLPGTHSITVTDANGLTATSTFEVGVEHVILPNPTVQDATCATCANGIVSLSPSGGTGPYLAWWDSGLPGGLTQAGLLPGIYTFHVSDVFGCQADSSSAAVGFPNAVNWQAASQLSVFPNPTSGHFQIDSINKGICTWQIFDNLSKLRMEGSGNKVNASQLNAGNYWLRVEEARTVNWIRITKID